MSAPVRVEVLDLEDGVVLETVVTEHTVVRVQFSHQRVLGRVHCQVHGGGWNAGDGFKFLLERQDGERAREATFRFCIF